MTSRMRVLLALLAMIVLGGAAMVYIGNVPAAVSTRSAPGGPGPRLQVLTNGVLSTVALADPGGPRTITELRCDRAHAAAGTVACLRPVSALAGTELVVLDADLHVLRSVKLTGFPNRLRVSPSGRMVSWTVFVAGHSYAGSRFSTRTGILDARSGQVVDSLEGFTALIDGRRHRAKDLNYWGVTFAADDNRFYATLATGGERYLVAGDLAARTVRTVARDVECPSLSPDGSRIAYKQAVDGDPAKGWRLSVRDLASGRITPLADPNNVDDQPLWLDGNTVAYARQRNDGINDVWAVPADGTGEPQLLTENANSPAVSSGQSVK